MKTKTLAIALAAALYAGGAGLAHASDLQPLIDRATQGDSAAMVEVGEALLARDKAIEGLMYLENVVRLGRPEEHVARAHAALGAHYLRITNNPIARATSRNHYEQAAILGHVPSQVQLGNIYLDEALLARGKERDRLLDRALVVLEHAASQGGDVEAAHVLGTAFMVGRGFKVNKDIGSAWLMVAADRGHASAASVAGEYELQNGRAQTAQHYLSMAANGGSAKAMMLLAEGYSSGRVLHQDTNLALAWAQQAKAAGAAGADRLIARLAPPPPPPPAPVIQAAPVTHYASYQPDPYYQPAVAHAPAPAYAPAVDPEEARLRELEARNAELQRQIRELTARVQGSRSGERPMAQQAAPQAPVAVAKTQQPAPAPAPAPMPQRPRDIAPVSRAWIDPQTGAVIAAGPAAPSPRPAVQRTPATVAARPVPAPATPYSDAPLAVAPPTPAAPPVVEAVPEAPEVMAEAVEARPVASTRSSRRAPPPSQNAQGLQEHSAGNYVQASRHFTRGVRAGDADAMNNLGMMLLQGQGVAPDRDRAMELFRQAAEKGHAVAARNISYMYQQGLGVRQDLARASVWMRHAGILERKQGPTGNYAGI